MIEFTRKYANNDQAREEFFLRAKYRLLLRKMRLHSLQEDAWKWQTLSDVAVKAYLCLNSILFVFLSCEHYVPVLFRIMFSYSRSLELSLIYNNVCFFILWLICQQGIWSQSAKKIHFTHVIGAKKDERLQICKIRTKFMSLDRLNTHRIV